MRYFTILALAVCGLAALAILRLFPEPVPIAPEFAHCTTMLGGNSNVGFDLSGDGSKIAITFGAKVDSEASISPVLIDGFLKCIGRATEDDLEMSVTVRSIAKTEAEIPNTEYLISGQCQADPNWPQDSVMIDGDARRRFGEAEQAVGVGWVVLGNLSNSDGSWLEQYFTLRGAEARQASLPPPSDLPGIVISPIGSAAVFEAPSTIGHRNETLFLFDESTSFCVKAIASVEPWVRATRDEGPVIWAGVARRIN